MSKENFMTRIISKIRKHPKLVEWLTKTAQAVSPDTVVVLDYPVKSKQRWTKERPHPMLYDIINKNRELYKYNLQSFLALSNFFSAINERPTATSTPADPYWVNGWMAALDGIALYSFLVTNKPKIYMEVGSGNSTKFAHKAIVDHNLDTKIVSIDPFPRAEINQICDEVIRRPVEDIDLQIFDRLCSNDILYIDNSHRALMNSDATTIFLDVIPRLKSGVLVEIHDILLPCDYANEWIDRHYSEQYLLAAYILAKGSLFDIILPNTFISHDNELRGIMAPLWDVEEMKNVEKHGCSFWIRMK